MKKNILLVISLVNLFLLPFSSLQADKLAKAWEVSGFNMPESVVYDSRTDIIFVSNVHGNPPEKDGVGYISTLKPNGEVIQLRWVEGLHAPKGMIVSGDKIYVSDVDHLVEVDINHGRVTGKWKAEGAKFLNDTAIDSAGNVYVSDMFGNSVYRLSNNKLEMWVQGNDIPGPNGLMVEGDDLLIATWGVIAEGFSTSTAGHLKKVSLSSQAVSSLGNGSVVGNLDGLEPDGHGSYYVTDWMAGSLYKIHSSGNADMLLDLNQGSADHEYIQSKKLIVIPMMLDGKIVAYKVK